MNRIESNWIELNWIELNDWLIDWLILYKVAGGRWDDYILRRGEWWRFFTAIFLHGGLGTTTYQKNNTKSTHPKQYHKTNHWEKENEGVVRISLFSLSLHMFHMCGDIMYIYVLENVTRVICIYEMLF
jgi:hypothetical protein